MLLTNIWANLENRFRTESILYRFRKANFFLFLISMLSVWFAQAGCLYQKEISENRYFCFKLAVTLPKIWKLSDKEKLPFYSLLLTVLKYSNLNFFNILVPKYTRICTPIFRVGLFIECSVWLNCTQRKLAPLHISLPHQLINTNSHILDTDNMRVFSRMSSFRKISNSRKTFSLSPVHRQKAVNSVSLSLKRSVNSVVRNPRKVGWGNSKKYVRIIGVLR